MKKNVMMRVASILLVAVLLTTCAISGTFAKYVATTTGTDSARVAKWNMRVNETGKFNSGTFVFDLFNTVKDTKDGTTETNITPNDGTIIAPGTTGSFDITISNQSEVTAKFWFAFSSVETSEIPIQYRITPQGGVPSAWTSDVATLGIAYASAVEIAVGGNTTYKIEWQWIFDGDDNVDTDLGKKDVLDTVTVTAVLNAEQVD